MFLQKQMESILTFQQYVEMLELTLRLHADPEIVCKRFTTTAPLMKFLCEVVDVAF